MKNLIFNIGLENNPMTETQVLDALHDKYMFVTAHKIAVGMYDGKPERTLIVEVVTSLNDVDLAVQMLCEEMTQECIAYMDGSNGKLIYNNKFVGEKFNFDSDYFLKF